ncbi:Uncharacterised protein [Mycobacteroides abscessus subsp. abscessus]|jgi:hypothetical protein|uniref:hypothetical protein n=1 Tax=Mycobacteroides abscessus TaxID=36809 RepID=UPI000927BEA3|nr:hypothetical protein [Mycobacteroides abscessus]SIH22645.1 Uncharacterised protein [Mycobacteroides abscessus subsp. abscessus]
MARTPEHIRHDLENAVRAADLDTATKLVFELVDDIRDSYRLALRHEHIKPDVIGEVEATVTDYISNHYGDN